MQAAGLSRITCLRPGGNAALRTRPQLVLSSPPGASSCPGLLGWTLLQLLRRSSREQLSWQPELQLWIPSDVPECLSQS